MNAVIGVVGMNSKCLRFIRGRLADIRDTYISGGP